MMDTIVLIIFFYHLYYYNNYINVKLKMEAGDRAPTWAVCLACVRQLIRKIINMTYRNMSTNINSM